MVATQPFKILYVCAGNNARSPLAVACTQTLLSGNGSEVAWEITSAGTEAAEDEPVRPEVLRVAESLRLDLSAHRTQPLDHEACVDADVILAMSWDQVSHIWSEVPEAWGKCFTMKEFVHWAKQAPTRPPILFRDKVEQMRDKVDQAHAVRKRARADHGFWGGMRPQDLNLVEPDGKGEAAWRNLAQAINLLVSDAVRLLESPGVVSAR